MNSLDQSSLRVLALAERIKLLEDFVFKKSKTQKTTRAPQMLLFHHPGLLEKIDELKVTKKKKAHLLSVILNISSDNIKDGLTTIISKSSPIVTSRNCEFLIKTFDSIWLKNAEGRL